MGSVQDESYYRISDVAARCADNIGWIEMNRPPANFLDAGLVESIIAASSWAADNGARSAVLCAEGKHFCAGANLTAPEPGQNLDARVWDAAERMYDAAARIFESPIPIVAAVHGAAVGGGMGLALAADFRVATPDTRFRANFSRLGFHHGFGLTVSLPEVIGFQHARDLLYTGRSVRGDEAYRIGLCDRLAPNDGLRAEAERFAAELAQAAPLSVQAIRMTMQPGIGDRVRAATRHERAEQRRLAATEDFKEGIRASRDRRPPQFTGR
jgi:2-(1,2-epoxy-1,2-dihydrophenyl)acetyl-CoA isomerase